MKKIAIGFAAAFLVLVVAVFGWRTHLISELKEPVLAQLKDPDSAQFKNVRYVGNWTVAGGILCGEVNAKSAMGGYIGYQWFDSDIGGAIIETDSTKKIYDDKKIERCDYSKDEFPWWWLKM